MSFFSPMGSKQGSDSQKRPMPSKSANVPGGKPGMKPGAGDGRPGTVPPGPEDRSRKPGRGIPSR